MPPCHTQEEMLARYRKIITALEDLRDSEALALVMITTIAIARLSNLDLVAVMSAFISLWEEPFGLPFEDGPPTERTPARDVN